MSWIPSFISAEIIAMLTPILWFEAIGVRWSSNCLDIEFPYLGYVRFGCGRATQPRDRPHE